MGSCTVVKTLLRSSVRKKKKYYDSMRPLVDEAHGSPWLRTLSNQACTATLRDTRHVSEGVTRICNKSRIQVIILYNICLFVYS